jgi:hypothetical protein
MIKSCEFVHVSAKPGEPSTLWIGDTSGLYYRTREAAFTDDPSQAYPYKPFLSKQLMLAFLGCSLLALVGWVYAKTKKH